MIKLENITKHFNSGTVDEHILFNNFNFTAEKGDFISVIGSNGSGKSTLLNLICGSITPDSGRIIFDNKDITKLCEYKRAKFIGRVFQDPKAGTSSDLTIVENMALADNKLKIYGLSLGVNKRRIDYYRTLLEGCKMGLENILSTTVGHLSGGHRQALAMIIANMTDIYLLILDEHTAALDPKSSETIMQLTDKIVRNTAITTIMVTHNLRFALEYGNRLFMMHQGNSILDINGEEKKREKIDDLYKIFNQISAEVGN